MFTIVFSGIVFSELYHVLKEESRRLTRAAAVVGVKNFPFRETKRGQSVK